MRTTWESVAIIAAVLAALAVPAPVGGEPAVPRSRQLAAKKGPAGETPSAVLATLAVMHGTERVALEPSAPTNERFSQLVADRVTGSTIALDPRLLELLRTLARRYPRARIELVSGYRSVKLNEMLRKKGHHVASHSQHSLGHAVDFRIVPDGAREPLAPRALKYEIRGLGWAGGVGIYPRATDCFVHADVGVKRHWIN